MPEIEIIEGIKVKISRNRTQIVNCQNYEEITEELKQQGFEDCTAEYQYYNATVKFPERFKPLVTATPRKKK